MSLLYPIADALQVGLGYKGSKITTTNLVQLALGGSVQFTAGMAVQASMINLVSKQSALLLVVKSDLALLATYNGKGRMLCVFIVDAGVLKTSALKGFSKSSIRDIYNACTPAIRAGWRRKVQESKWTKIEGN